MIADAYPYVFVMNENVDYGGHVSNAYYSFRSTKSHLRYTIYVERFVYNVYIVNFYLSSMKDSSKRYSHLTNTFEPRKVVNTCINVMLDIYEHDPYASFGFIGAGMDDDDVNDTKRFRFYSTMIATYFSDRLFHHKENKANSSYLLINRRHMAADPQLESKVQDFFVQNFTNFG